LDVYAHLVGAVPDSEVAAMAKMSVEGVRLYRKARGIPSSFEVKAGAAAPEAAVSKPAVARAAVSDAPPKMDDKVAVVKTVSAPASPEKPEAVETPAVTAVASAVVVPAVAADAASHRVFSVVAVHGDELRKFAVVGANILAALDIAVNALNARKDGPWRVGSIREGIEALTLPG
jgi:hypothetical protein